MDRREFLIGAGLGAAAAALPTAAPAIGRNLPDVTVIGAGAFGAWTALNLRERGAKVTLLDSYGAGNARGASGDETRQIRCAYGGREIYSRWASHAFGLWHQRQDEFKRRLIFDNGVLSPDAPKEEFEEDSRILTKLNIPFETLTTDEARKRWPQGRFEGDAPVMFEPKAGTVKARETLVAVTEVFVQKGGTYRLGLATPGESKDGKLTSLKLADGTSLSCGMAIFACGPWLAKVFTRTMKGFIRPSRAEVFYLGSPPGDLSYHWERFPNIRSGGIGYSLSDVDYGYKIAPRWPNNLPLPMDPDSDERIVSPIMREVAYRFAAQYTPGLVNQPVVASRVCNLEDASGDDFIIDTHPELSNLWITGGGSGHAFKMGPALGEYIADRVTGAADPAEERKLFALASHKALTES